MLDNGEYRNPNAEDCVLQPGEKRVRFSISDITFYPHINPAYEQESGEESASEGESELRSKFQEVRTRRRDSVYPMNIPSSLQMDLETDLSDQESSNMNDTKIAKLADEIDPDESDDPFAITDFEEEPTVPWSTLSRRDKIWKVVVSVSKAVALLGLLYFFVCSLDLLSKGFRLIGGRTAGEIFRQSEILQNPVVGVMIGILTTVLVQSSSTSTSIIVGMVAAGFMDVKIAIPLIMGANIGTSITNTVVSFMQAGDRDQFRRAFAGATILDMFNWITVIILLLVEVLTGYLYHLSGAVVGLLVPDPEGGGEIKLLSALTTPFINLIVQLDESVLDCWSMPNCTDKFNASLIKEYCKSTSTNIEVVQRLLDSKGALVSTNQDVIKQESNYKCSKEFIFAGTNLSDTWVGVIVLIVSLIVLCSCLILIVKVLSSVLKGHVSIIIKKTLNADIPYVPWITGYIAIFVGAVMTFIVQSSSVFTSALTPLVGLGVISLKRVYPLTLGSNIGTTTTAVLASFSVEPRSFKPSMQIALCHFFFNVTGIILFYPIPQTRIPIQMAKFLGNTTAKYRWFAIAYMVVMFAILPAVFIGLSIAGPVYVITLLSVMGFITAFVLIVTILQKKLPKILPVIMHDWKWLPEPLRSLRPYDNLLGKFVCCASLHSKGKGGQSDEESDERYEKSNFVFYPGDAIPPPAYKEGGVAQDNGNSSRKRKPKDQSNGVIKANNHNNNQHNDEQDNPPDTLVKSPLNPTKLLAAAVDNSRLSNDNKRNRISDKKIDNHRSTGNRDQRQHQEDGSDNEGFRSSSESVIV